MLAGGIFHLKSLSLGVGQWHVLYRGEGDAIEFVGAIEESVAHVLQFEIWA